jgi:hypothetical protein
VLTFDEPVVGGAGFNVTLSSGTLSGPATVNGNTLTFRLAGAADAQVLVVTVNGLTDADGNVGTYRLHVGVLWGDVNGNGEVNVNDTNIAKSVSGQAVTAANFRADLNLNAELNVNDVNIAKSRSGGRLPAVPPAAPGAATSSPTQTGPPALPSFTPKRTPVRVRPTSQTRPTLLPLALARTAPIAARATTSVVGSNGPARSASPAADLLADEGGLLRT